MPNTSKADFQLIVGADIPASTEQLKKDIKSILESLTKTSQNVKLGFEFDEDDAKAISKDIVKSVNNKLGNDKIDISKIVDAKGAQKSLSNTDQLLQKISSDLSEILTTVTMISSKSMTLSLGNIWKPQSVDVGVYKKQLAEYVEYLDQALTGIDKIRIEMSELSRQHPNLRGAASKALQTALLESGKVKDPLEFASSLTKELKKSESVIQKSGSRITTIQTEITKLQDWKKVVDSIYEKMRQAYAGYADIKIPDSSKIDQAVARTAEAEERIRVANERMQEQQEKIRLGEANNPLSQLSKTTADSSQIVAQNVTVMAQQTGTAFERVGEQAADMSTRTETALQNVSQQASSTSDTVKQTLSGIQLSMSEIDASKLKTIETGLIIGKVKDSDVPKVVKEFEDVSGVITDVTAKYDTFTETVQKGEKKVEQNIEHISQLVIKGADEMGTAFQKTINWVPKFDKDGAIFDWDKRTAGLVKYTAETNSAAEASRRLAEVERARFEINDKISQVIGKQIDAQRSGMSPDSFGFQGLVDFELKLQNLAGELGNSITSYDEFKQKLFEIQTTYAGVNNQIKIDTAELKDNTAAEKEAEAIARAHLQVEREIKRLEGQGKTAERNGVSQESKAYQDLSKYVNDLNELQRGLDDGSIKLDEFRRRLVEIQTTYAGVNNQIKEETIAVREAAQAQAELVDKGKALKELQSLQAGVQADIDKAAISGVIDNEAIDRLRACQQTYSDLEEVVRNNDIALTNYKAITDAVKSSVNEANKELDFAVRLHKEDEAAANAAAKAEAEAVKVEESRARIIAELNRVQSVNMDAAKNGVSSDAYSVQQVEEYAEKLYELESRLSEAKMTQKEFNEELAKLQAEYKADVLNVQNMTKAQKEQNTHIAKGTKVYEQAGKALKDYEGAQNDSSEKVRESYEAISTLQKRLSDAADKYRSGKMNTQQYDDAVKQATADLKEHNDVLKAAGYGVEGTSSKFAELTQQLTRFITPLYLARKAWQTVKEMANVVIELEDAFASLQIVTGATDKELEEFYGTAVNIATNLGKSITDIAGSIEVFSRLGYALQDATALAEQATVLSNVARVTADEATTGLTSIIKGYNMHVENAEHVADVLINIGQKYAVSAGELMEAYEKSGAALAATNTSFEKSAALIAAANSAVQNSSVVGTALKTVSARIRGSKDDLKELGEDAEELVNGFSKYAKELKALTGFDIMVEGTTDKFKDLYDIMDGIAAVWDKLTDTQQARTAEILGGTRQLQVIASILRNWEDAQNAYADAQNSAGEAARANAIYMDTTTAHINQFKAAFQDLSHTVIDSGLLKSIVDLGTALLNMADGIAKFISSAGGLAPIITSLASLALIFNGANIVSALVKVGGALTGIIAGVKTGIGTIIASAQGLTGVVTTLDVVSAGTATAASSLTAMASGIGVVILAASALAAVVSKVNHELAQQRENAIQAGDAAADEGKTLTELIAKYEDLSKAGASNEEILAARDEVIDKLDLEYGRLDKLIRQYGSYEEAIKQAAYEQLNLQRQTIQGGYNAAREGLTANGYEGASARRTINYGKEDANANGRAIGLLQDQGYISRASTGSQGSILNYDLGDLSTYEGVIDAHKRLHEMMTLLVEDGNANNAVYQDLFNLYEQLSVGVDDYNGSLKNLADNIASVQYLSQEKPTDLESYAKLREDLIIAIQAQNEFKDSTFDVSAAVDDFLSRQDGMEEFASKFANASDETVEAYQNIIKEIQEKDVDLTKTVFGNIDMNNRQTIEWTRQKVAEFARELQSWGEDLQNIVGSVSTVFGSSAEYDGVEIAFSPILQTPNGPVLLSRETVDQYIFGLIEQAGEGWHNEDLLRLDTQGLEIDGLTIKNLLADIGDTARKTGEDMHYVGDYGALSMARGELMSFAQEMYNAAQSSDILKRSLEDVKSVSETFDSVTNSLKGITDIQGAIANGFIIDAQKAMEFAEAYPGILDNATITADGQIKLNEDTANSFIAGKEAEIKAAFTAKIAELEGDREVLVAKRDIAVAQLKMAEQVANGESELTYEQLKNQIENQNKAAEAFIQMGMDEADAYSKVYENMSKNGDIFGGNFSDVMASLAAESGSAAGSMATAFNTNVGLMNNGMGILIGNAHQVAAAIDAMGKGKIAGAIGYTDGGGNGQSINTFNKSFHEHSFGGVKVSYTRRTPQLNSLIQQLNTDISGYTSAINSIDSQISALYTIMNSSLSSVGSNRTGGGGGGRGGSGGGGGGGGGSGSSSSSKEETWFEKQYKLHQHYLNMDQETTEDFLKWLEKAYKQAYQEGIITLDEYYKYEEEIYKTYQKIKEAAKSTYDALVDYRVKMLKQERQNEKEALNDKLSDLKEYYSKQKELLQKQADEAKYIDEQGEKRKTVNDIKQQIAQLQFDTSAWAQKRREELLQQLSDAEKELQDFEDQHALEEALNALDEAYNAEEEKMNKQIEAIDDLLNDPEALYNQALQDINNNTEDLFKAFLLFNKKYGDGDDETIYKMWEEAFKNSEAFKSIFGSYYNDAPIGNYTGYTAPTPPTNPTPPAPSGGNSGGSSSSGSSSSSKSSAPSLASGSTVQVKTSATHFSPKSGSVRMASFVPGGKYTVYQTSGNEVLIGRNGVYTGWIYKTDIVGYKKGTKNATPGLHKINEEGTEAIFSSGDGQTYRMFSGGEKVLNAKATNFLYEFAMAGADILEKMRGKASDTFRNVGTVNQPIDITMGDIIINGDVSQQSVSEVRRAQREQINDVLKAFNRYQITLYRATK